MSGIRSSTTYGIDAGEGFTAVVRASGSARGASFVRLYQGVGDSSDEDLAAAAAEVALAAADHRAVAAAAMPARDTVVRRLATPLTSIARAMKVLPSLLDVRIPFRLEECAVAFPEIRRDADGRVSALAAAAPAEAVAHRLAQLKSLGFDPMALDAEALALWARALEEHPATPGLRRVTVYAGMDRFVLASGMGAEFEAAYSVREAARNPASGGAPDAWATALQRGRQAVAGPDGALPDGAEWIWTGPGVDRMDADLRAFEAAFDANLRMQWIRVPEPSLFLARALAARATAAVRGGCNLRTGSMAHPKLAEWRAASERRASWACMAAGLLLAAVSMAATQRMGRDAEALRERVDAEARRIGRLVRVQRGQEVRMAQEAVEKRRAASEPVVRLFQPSASSILAGLLRVASPAAISFEMLDITEASVLAQGTAPDRDVIARVEDFLRLQGYRTQVKRGDPGADGRVSFSVSGAKS